ncbi:MAG: class I tRNA ligase family protein [Patescibacteria group bacterium]
MDLPVIELKILDWWRENKIFEKSVEKPASRGDFVFYEGPPTANGKPGIHHVLARAFKDIIPRFKTMQGYRVVRKAGWDTHGLPVELEVEKQLGLKNKKEVEAYGIAAFNQKCKESVWKYKDEWEKLTARMGFWVDMEHPYVTYTAPYVEALWGVIKLFHERGLLIEGHKVVPHCPRCGTALSSHELALGYQSVKDLSLTIKFEILNPKSEINSKFKIPHDGKVFILSWTTTPWTLPGNVALAVGENINYVMVRRFTGEWDKAGKAIYDIVILAQDIYEELEKVSASLKAEPFHFLFDETPGGREVTLMPQVLSEFKGKELVGLEYEPLFNVPALKSSISYKVYAADFVSTTDGTGVVHTAVMYGEDDYNLGTAVGLPKKHTVDEAGLFNADAPEFVRGKFVKDPETEKLIIADLEKRGLVFKKELYEHDYPYCWRCRTPLLYYAKHSWFVAMSTLRNELIETNNQINWVPDYIKEGRFGEWLREVKDWAFSRERYWGTPLPIWRCQGSHRTHNMEHETIDSGSMIHDTGLSGCGRVEVIGSVAELVQRARLKNRYIFMRHGRAVSNVNDICNGSVEISQSYPLVEEGIAQVRTTITTLKNEKIDAIYSSDFLRTQQTAEMIAKELGVPVLYDARIREYAVGVYEGKSTAEYNREFPSVRERFLKKPEGGETYGEILKRMADFMKGLESGHEGKTFLIVSHGDPLWILIWALNGSPGALDNYTYPIKGNPIMVESGIFLTNALGEADLHRPFVDDIIFPCTCGGVMRRVPEVADVWFDSGAMPFAQYPENIEALSQEGTKSLRQFPADYISEAIDQTRGWFYTLLAVSVALGKGAPYRNVICLGHILDAKGKKMSKSLGNIIVPEDVFAKYGADAVRWYLFTVNDPGLPKRFDEKEIMEIVKKFFMILWNVVSFHELYPPEQFNSLSVSQLVSSKNLGALDRWILARLNQLIALVTERLEAYDVTPAGRAIEEFVTDLSTWYVRRSRERMKTGSESRAVLRYVLIEFSKLIAPFIPFTAEALWQKIHGTQNMEHGTEGSVHLADWPQAGEIDKEVLVHMDAVRKVVEVGLAARAAAKIPVRQPLQRASIKYQESGIKEEYADILKDELNVKEVVFEKSTGPLSVELDTHLTEELKLEGMKREFIRAVNNLRKEAKLTIKDQIVLSVQKTPISEQLINTYKNDLLKATISSEVRFVEEVASTRHAQVKLGGEDIVFGF